MTYHHLIRKTLWLLLGVICAGLPPVLLLGSASASYAVLTGILISGLTTLVFLSLAKCALLKKDRLFMLTVFGGLFGRFLIVCLSLCLYLYHAPGLVPAFLAACLGSYLIFLIFEIRILASGAASSGRERLSGV
jgi:hypothetical protein